MSKLQKSLTVSIALVVVLAGLFVFSPQKASATLCYSTISTLSTGFQTAGWEIMPAGILDVGSTPPGASHYAVGQTYYTGPYYVATVHYHSAYDINITTLAFTYYGNGNDLSLSGGTYSDPIANGGMFNSYQGTPSAAWHTPAAFTYQNNSYWTASDFYFTVTTSGSGAEIGDIVFDEQHSCADTPTPSPTSTNTSTPAPTETIDWRPTADTRRPCPTNTGVPSATPTNGIIMGEINTAEFQAGGAVATFAAVLATAVRTVRAGSATPTPTKTPKIMPTVDPANCRPARIVGNPTDLLDFSPPQVQDPDCFEECHCYAILYGTRGYTGAISFFGINIAPLFVNIPQVNYCPFEFTWKFKLFKMDVGQFLIYIVDIGLVGAVFRLLWRTL